MKERRRIRRRRRRPRRRKVRGQCRHHYALKGLAESRKVTQEKVPAVSAAAPFIGKCILRTKHSHVTFHSEGKPRSHSLNGTRRCCPSRLISTVLNICPRVAKDDGTGALGLLERVGQEMLGSHKLAEAGAEQTAAFASQWPSQSRHRL